MEKVLVSACLMGVRVRYDGGDMYCDHPVLRDWIAEGRVISCCPEILAGFPVPRESDEISAAGDGFSVLDGKATVTLVDGTDHTEPFLEGAYAVLKIVKRENIKLAILKNNSPSCGSSQIYSGSFDGSKSNGLGVTTALLKRNGLEVFSEEAIEAAAEWLKILEGG